MLMICAVSHLLTRSLFSVAVMLTGCKVAAPLGFCPQRSGCKADGLLGFEVTRNVREITDETDVVVATDLGRVRGSRKIDIADIDTVQRDAVGVP